jgi:hypothetical protein
MIVDGYGNCWLSCWLRHLGFYDWTWHFLCFPREARLSWSSTWTSTRWRRPVRCQLPRRQAWRRSTLRMRAPVTLGGMRRGWLHHMVLFVPRENTIYIHTYLYIYIHTFIHLYFFLHSYIHTFMHSCIHAFIHSYIHTVIHSYIHTFMHSYIHTYIRSYMHTFIHSYIHSFKIHTFIHTFIHTYSWLFCGKIHGIPWFLITEVANLGVTFLNP